MTEALINDDSFAMVWMGTEVTLQVVQRQGGPQYTFTVPRPIAEAMGFTKGMIVDMSIHQGQLIIQRKTPAASALGRVPASQGNRLV